MSRYRNLAFGLVVSVVAVVAVFMSLRSSAPPEPSYPITRHVKYRFTVENTTNQAIKNGRFRAFAPVEQTSFQKTRSIDSNHPFELQADQLGNQLMEFELDVLPPHGAKVITVSAKVGLAQKPQVIKGVNAALFLGQEPNVESTHSLMQQKAAELKAPRPAQTLKNIYDWVSSKLEYAGYIKQDRGALYALKNQRGDCTEYMYLFMALARANQIPVRGVGGYVVKEDAVLRARDYHNWAEVYINKRWHNVDAQNKVYMKQGDSYLALRIISPENSNLLPNTHRYAVAGEGLKVRMH